jgi:hypothetical protein
MHTADGVSPTSDGQHLSLVEAFEVRVGDATDLEAVADAFDEIWNVIDARLHQVIGMQLINGLYSRSLDLASQSYPWLQSVQNSMLRPTNLAAYRSYLLQQEQKQAVSASKEVLSAFEKIFVDLVGYSLSRFLLSTITVDVLLALKD